ncbi:glycosyltransferase family 2 protein [Mycetocola lacteus]|uniref:glycosyltransferase family 2 protein n=1 Tax=Mycetocola lacteus TaxID=76637 RepID=UPI00160315E0|nr:glycosyltransferase [Mycetocola lacteus]
MSNTPKISVIMAAYNNEATIGAALESLLVQTMPDFEVVVFDDGSSDKSGLIACELNDPRIRVIGLGRNVGRAAARDHAIRAARADIIAIADADDASLPTRLEDHLAIFAAHPEATVTYGQITSVLPDGTPHNALRFPETAAEVDAQIRRGRMPVPHTASAFRREWYLTSGGYDKSIRWCEDYDLFARAWAPGTYVPGTRVGARYTIASRFPSWNYWWENERHLRAINARIQAVGRPAAGGEPFSPFLQRNSRGGTHAIELFRYVAVRLRDTLRGTH